MIKLERLFGLHVSETTESRIDQTVMLFERAKPEGSIKIVTGELEKGFYEDPKIIKALEEAVNRKVSVDIIFGPTMDIGNDNLKRLWEEGKVNLWLLPQWYNNHFMIVDDKHARVEEIHLPEAERKAYMYKTVWLGNHLADKFVELQMKAKCLSPDKAEDKNILEGIQKDTTGNGYGDAGGAGPRPIQPENLLS